MSMRRSLERVMGMAWGRVHMIPWSICVHPESCRCMRFCYLGRKEFDKIPSQPMLPWMHVFTSFISMMDVWNLWHRMWL